MDNNGFASCDVTVEKRSIGRGGCAAQVGLVRVELRRRVISAFDEIRDLGHLGRECLKLINKLTREEVARFPALTPEAGWQPTDLEDLVGKFLTERLEKVTTNLLALATDDASVGRLLRKSIRY